MKTLTRAMLSAALIFAFNHSIIGQTTQADTGKQISLIQWMWKLQAADIFELGQKEAYFYRAFCVQEDIPVPETHGVEDRVFLLIGEFGERPDGKILDCGLWGKVTAITMNKAASEITISYSKAGKSMKQTLSIF